MRTAKRLVAGAMIASLAGCATPVWNKPGATEADFNKDRAYCEYEAEKYAGNYMYGTQAMSAAIRKTNLGIMCMQQQGWTRSYGSQPQPQQPFTHVPVDLIKDGQKVRIN